MSSKPLAGMTAVVTGANGGIGSASAELLLRDGATVMILARRRKELEETKAELLAAVPDGRVELFVGDGMVETDIETAFAQAHAIHNRLDIVVATVGGGNGFKPMLMLDAETFRAQFDRNVVSAFLAIRYGAPLMEPGGSIVCISSTAAKLPFNGLAAYHTAKGALENLVRAAAEELGAAGIRVNAVRPGLTRSKRVGYLFTDDTIFNKFLDEFPLGRAGMPMDIGHAVRYLAGPEAAWVTGQSFAVDGGQELRKNPDLGQMLEANVGKEAFAAVKRGKIPR
ncbi:MAG TPA: SDR family oxidoreductase [Alphaproteobacteria bacterium]|nr:SDR family oxidoreductase [Alphaproteobacteria bacterium]